MKLANLNCAVRKVTRKVEKEVFMNKIFLKSLSRTVQIQLFEI